MGHFSDLAKEAVMPKRSHAPSNEALFEDNYLLRTLGRIAYDPKTALAELVANAWDAGAGWVNVIIPDERGGLLTVEDDGHGMSRDQFRARWMKLGYNRSKAQGPKVEFPPERSDWSRQAFGRNGIGRHGLLCFSDEYTVETTRKSKLNRPVFRRHLAAIIHGSSRSVHEQQAVHGRVQV